MTYSGIKIVPQPLAVERWVEFRVVPWAAPRRKKRKGWRVLRFEFHRPGCWQVGDTFYMHPELIAKLPR